MGSELTTVRRGRKAVLLMVQHAPGVWVLILAPTVLVLALP